MGCSPLRTLIILLLVPLLLMAGAGKKSVEASPGKGILVGETDDHVSIDSSAITANIRKRGYVSGVEGGSFVDKKTGFHDAGFGLDIVDWLMEPGSDEAYRNDISPEIVYEFNNLLHGKTAKRSVEGPQICTQAKELPLKIVRGHNYAAVSTHYRYTMSAPGKFAGSEWKQTIVFPQGKRWFISSDAVTTVNACKSLFLRLDMPGHIRHHEGDIFSEVYLSYLGTVPASAFLHDFAPDAAYNYERATGKVPKRFIRAYHLRDPNTGKDGPWLAGMTLAPAAVSEAWCHQRGYVCMIEEIGGRPVQPGDTFGAAFIVGYFDSIEEMNQVYDHYSGSTGLVVDSKGWHTVGAKAVRRRLENHP